MARCEVQKKLLATKKQKQFSARNRVQRNSGKFVIGHLSVVGTHGWFASLTYLAGISAGHLVTCGPLPYSAGGRVQSDVDFWRERSEAGVHDLL